MIILDHSEFITTFHPQFAKNFINKRMWWIYALLSAFFAALTAILAKKGVSNMDSDYAMAIRTVVILIVAWGFALAKGSIAPLEKISTRNLTFLVLSGIATGLSWIFYFKALQVGKVSQVAPVDKLSLALTILLSVLVLGEALTWQTAVGSVLIIAGVFILIL